MDGRYRPWVPLSVAVAAMVRARLRLSVLGEESRGMRSSVDRGQKKTATRDGVKHFGSGQHTRVGRFLNCIKELGPFPRPREFPTFFFLSLAMSTLTCTPQDRIALRRLLQHDNHENRDKMLDFMAKDPLYVPRLNVSLEFEREIALRRLQKLAHNGFISVYDFEKNPLNIFAGK